MFQFVTTTMDLYYKQRLLSLANNRLDNFVALRFTISRSTADTVSSHTIQATDSDDVFHVQSRTGNQQTWKVDLTVGTCTCPRGRNGQPCGHQLAASLKYKRHSLNKIPTSSVCDRQLYAKIAIEEAALPVAFYSHLHQKEEDTYVKDLGLQPEWSKRTETFPSSQHTEIEDQETTIDYEPASPESDHASEDPQQHQSHTTSSNFEDTLTDLTYVMTDIKKGLAGRNTVFTTAIREFCSQYKKRGADSKEKSYTKPLLISALHKFEKGHGRKIRSNKRTITVQPTAVSRRAIKKCGGKPLKAGRPSLMQRKSNNTNMKNLYHHTLPKRKLRSKRVHSLQTSIDNRRQKAC